MNDNNAQAGPSTAPRATSSTIPTPAEIPSGFNRWRSSLAQFTGLGLSDEEKQIREEAKANDTLVKDWDRCEKYKRELMTDSMLPSSYLGNIHSTNI
jgi:inner membrane protease ATP23